MALNLATGYRRLPTAFIDTFFRNAIAGVICAIVTLVFSLSYATLIFSGSLAPWLAYGMAATFITAAIGAIVMACRSSLPFALASPDGQLVCRRVDSQVAFKRLSEAEMSAYLSSGEWHGKAGGYAIQGRAAALISWVCGSYTNVVGLPLFETVQLLSGRGYRPNCTANC